MTLQASGAISLGNIRTELGAAGAISLGQASVRSLLVRPSGSVNMSHGYSKSAASINSFSGSAEDNELSPADALASITLNSNGTITTVGNTLIISPAKWWSAAPATGIGSSYWVKMTVTSGTAPSSGSGTGVVSLSTSPSWTQLVTTNGFASRSCVMTFDFYSNAAGTILVRSVTGIGLTAIVEI